MTSTQCESDGADGQEFFKSLVFFTGLLRQSIHPALHSSINPSIHLSSPPLLHQSIHLSSPPLLHQSVHPSIHFIPPSVSIDFSKFYNHLPSFQPFYHNPSTINSNIYLPENSQNTQFIHPFIHPLIHPSIHPPIRPLIHPPIHPSIHPFIHPSTHSSIHSSISPSWIKISATPKQSSSWAHLESKTKNQGSELFWADRRMDGWMDRKKDTKRKKEKKDKWYLEMRCWEPYLQ